MNFWIRVVVFYRKRKICFALNIENYVFGNLVPVTIGNILGGILLLGLPLFYLNRETAGVKEKETIKEGAKHDAVYQRGVASTGN